MNLDDESQLSAFLDDELDPGDRLLVAWSIESSPTSARELADLKVTGAMIQGLARPPIPIDLSEAIARKLAPTRKTKPRRSITRIGRFAAAIVGVGAMAASLFLALTLLHRSLHDDPTSRLAQFDAAHPVRTDSISSPESNSPASKSKLATPNREGSPSSLAANSTASVPADKSARDTEPTGVDGPEPARPGQIDAMLGHRKVLRALIVTDVIDRTSRRVRALIEGDASREVEFGQIKLTQGIVVDPNQPGEAEVYSVVISESGSRPFLERLRRDFPLMEFEGDPEPSLITQLSEIGQVAVFSKARPARLGLPPGEIPTLVAAKAASTSDHFAAPAVVSVDSDLAQGPGDPLAKARAAQRPDPQSVPRHVPAVAPLTQGGAPSGSPARTKVEDEPVTVLVWITRP